MSNLASVTQKEAGTFVSMLASFTGNSPKPTEAWDDSALSDDVSTISYEQALRSHRRVPAAESLTVYETADREDPSAANSATGSTAKNRKTSSITIRLTQEEEIQLHDRAAAAQLSVSAYLRSCIFEAESLRAQVKEALSQMRSTTTEEKKSCESEKQPPGWRSRFLPHWYRDRSAA